MSIKRLGSKLVSHKQETLYEVIEKLLARIEALEAKYIALAQTQTIEGKRA